MARAKTFWQKTFTSLGFCLPGGRVQLHLVDDLDCHHLAGEDVLGQLNDGVVTLAEGLAQVVHSGNHLIKKSRLMN
jgi:hypothetical protein